MKKSSILLLIAIAVCLGLAVSMFGNLSSYETYKSASEKAGEKFVVMGTLDSTLPIVYNPAVNADQFEFHAKDKTGQPFKVVFNGTKPQDFERAESLVMTGFVKDNTFHCEKIQMKCPSKYEEDQVAVAKPS